MSVIDIDWNPNARKLREFAGVWLGGFALLGALAAWKSGAFSGEPSWRIPLLLWGVGLSIGLLGLARPAWVKPIYLAWMGLAFPLGWILSHLFLGIVFYGIFTGVGLFFRLIGRDPLRRRREPVGESFWVERPQAPETQRYFRQF